MRREQIRILIGENEKNYAEELRQKILSGSPGSSLEIVLAYDEKTTRQLLEETHFDLAIIDIRLRDDTDRLDYSGYLLAERAAAKSIPTIVMTSEPAFAFITRRDKNPSAARYISFWGKYEQVSLMDLIEATLLGRRVFVVHGRNLAALNSVENTLYRMGLHPIVLQKEPGRSRVILRKFEDYASNVGYIVAILTADDIGGLDSPDPDLARRARQNVVFELGYFIGKYGAERVSILIETGIELFSDLGGVETIPYSPVHNTWILSLYNNMREIWPDLTPPLA